MNWKMKVNQVHEYTVYPYRASVSHTRNSWLKKAPSTTHFLLYDQGAKLILD